MIILKEKVKTYVDFFVIFICEICKRVKLLGPYVAALAWKKLT